MKTRHRILVIGLGNPDRGDDGVGLAVARKLAGRLAGADVITRSGDVLALYEDWAGYEVVFLIDAAAPVSEPGRIHRIDVASEELLLDSAPSSTHALDLAGAIALARSLGILPTRMIIYAVEGAWFTPGSSLSSAAARASGDVARRLAGEVTSLCSCEEETHV